MRTPVLAVAALLLSAFLLNAAIATPGTHAENRLIFQTNMYGSDVVPPVDTQAWGFVRFFFNADRSEADYTVDVKTLSNTLVAGADIQRGRPGENGPVVHHLADGDFIVIGGHLKLTQADIEEMASGDWYVTVKTYARPDGEIRGQVEVPPNFLVGTPTPTATATVSATPRPAVRTPLAGGTGGGTAITPPNTGDAGLINPVSTSKSGVSAEGALVLAAVGATALAAIRPRSPAAPRPPAA
jgi:hypothetical protein